MIARPHLSAIKRRDILLGAAAITVGGAGAAFLGLRQIGSMDAFDASVAASRSALSEAPETRDLVRFATLAANSHNTQAWRFNRVGERIEIRPDLSRRLAAVDPDDHHLYVSLGCAAENLSIAAGARGQAGELSFDPQQDGVVRFAFGKGPPPPSGLFEAITRRQSTRGDYDGRPVSGTDLQVLGAAVATVPGVDLVLITDRPQIDRVRDLVVAGNSAQIADPAFMRELKAWLRFSPRQAMQTGDGLFSATSGNPVLPAWLGPLAIDTMFTASKENDKYARQIASSAGIAVFCAEKDDPEHWVLVGRACQRFALQATALGLKHAFINQPVEVPALRPDLARLVGLPGRRPDIVMRFGYGAELPFSARRPVEAVLA